MNVIKKIIFFAFAFCLFFSLFAQEVDNDTEAIIPEENQNSIGEEQPFLELNRNAIFIIDNIDFKIKGRTRPYALIRYCDLNVGEEIHGIEKLEKYIKDKTQLLINQRVLSTAKIEYTIGEVRPDEKYPVDMVVTAEDTWNIIAVPYPKYDSNTGFELILKARDYNFFGTMNPLRLDIGYKNDQRGKDALIIELESDTPFVLFGYNWNFYLNNYFNYRPDVEEPFYYKNATGLSMQLPFKATTFTFGVEESLYLNYEHPDSQKPYYTSDFQKGLFMQSKAYSSWKIPTGINVFDKGELTYNVNLSYVITHGFTAWPLAEYLRGSSINMSHSFGFSKIDWVGNYRKGHYAYLSNGNSYSFYNLQHGDDPLYSSFYIMNKNHFIISDFFGISTFFQYRQWFYHEPDYYDKAADALRGILDNSITANYMLSLNLDFPLRVLRFYPSEWFKTKKLKFFDFEMHLSPIIDMALYHDPKTNTSFNFKNMLVSGGGEIILFPAFMRSLYLRLSFAWNIIEQFSPTGRKSSKFPYIPIGNNREIFIGIGHHY